ncbi:MAG TPA: UDP-glucose 4-epimerase GalE [Streptosporangiaceae bacterium]|jgi:UDP-glucose 4-epimerase
MRLLVTGGAGYIGSVVAAQLADDGHDVVVLDDLSTGHEDAVPAAASFRRGTLRDGAQAVLGTGIDAVLHFAAKSLVGESVEFPDRYWENNLGGTLALLEAMRVTGTRRIVFSSTAAVYGEPEHIPITETDPVRPTSPYGASKVAVDTALAEYARMHQVGAVSLRYFNVAGAHADAAGTWRGERHAPETHLIPTVLAAARSGGPVRLFGDDYPTPDGTCIRDYIHVSDLARAHVLALEATGPGAHRVYNLGSGTGYSNREVLAACQEVTGRDIPAQIAPRRAGDPAVLVASSEAIAADLDWRPERDLRDMVADAWTFVQQPAQAR